MQLNMQLYHVWKSDFSNLAAAIDSFSDFIYSELYYINRNVYQARISGTCVDMWAISKNKSPSEVSKFDDHHQLSLE